MPAPRRLALGLPATGRLADRARSGEATSTPGRRNPHLPIAVRSGGPGLGGGQNTSQRSWPAVALSSRNGELGRPSSDDDRDQRATLLLERWARSSAIHPGHPEKPARRHAEFVAIARALPVATSAPRAWRATWAGEWCWRR